MKQEIDTITKYINEHFGKDFIKPSLLAVAAPVLLVRKPRDELKFCIDYKALNAITVKNRYSISLINKTFSKLLNARQFTKLDIIHAFNRIRIKKS